MELEKQARIVDDIRAELQERIDTRLKVRANMGRSKVIECEGVLMQAHPSLFILEIDRKRGRKARQSYQYVDVLTGMVELYDVEDAASPCSGLSSIAKTPRRCTSSTRMKKRTENRTLPGRPCRMRIGVLHAKATGTRIAVEKTRECSLTFPG